MRAPLSPVRVQWTKEVQFVQEQVQAASELESDTTASLKRRVMGFTQPTWVAAGALVGAPKTEAI